jgi:hypothetical protein
MLDIAVITALIVQERSDEEKQMVGLNLIILADMQRELAGKAGVPFFG